MILNYCLRLKVYYWSVFLALFCIPNYTEASKQDLKTIKFIAAHGPYELVMKPLDKFRQEVESKSNGRIKVEIILSDSVDNNLSAEKKVLDGLKKNKFQMSQIYSKTLAEYEVDFLALEIPFLFKSHEHSFSVVDGEIGKGLLANLEKKSQFKGLGFTYCGGYRFIATKSKRIESAEDLKKLKIASGTFASSKFLQVLGADTHTKMEKKSIREAVENSSLDGLVTVFPRFLLNGENKIATLVSDLFFNMQFTVIVVNKEFFNSLDINDQKIIENAVDKIAKMEREIAVDLANQALDFPEKFGISIVRMPESEKKKIHEIVAQVDWIKTFNISPELVKKINGNMP